ncbi:hypothetical protein [Paenibacillus sp. 7516]|uniref:hypothetical protein n=1 Tax=Paenibacillus sp. 7516 TaxID=2022549 RepID=UPI000BA74034|nr:hypothetical protein [Paenibacillus sp. 7516]PAF33238.1 hypothetical protein CHI14_03365 [Paenibacillus sp. 7516]
MIVQLKSNISDKVKQIYSEIGENWPKRLPDSIVKGSENWGLSYLVVLVNFYNVMFFGTSRVFDDIVLKIGIDIISETSIQTKLNNQSPIDYRRLAAFNFQGVLIPVS